MKKCTCGEQNPEFAQFCANCGNGLEAKSSIKCPICGVPMEAQAKFCLLCGHNLTFPLQTISNPKHRKSSPIMAISLASVAGFLILGFLAVLAISRLSPPSSLTGASVTDDINVPSLPAAIIDAQTPQPSETIQASTPTSVPKPTKTPTSLPTDPVGRSRSNPIPRGTPLEVDGIIFTVTGITRPYYHLYAPDTGREYMSVDITLKCNRGQDEKCDFSANRLELSGSSGMVHDSEFLIVIPNLAAGEFYGGSTMSGGIAYQVLLGETDLILSYEPYSRKSVKGFISLGQ